MPTDPQAEHFLVSGGSGDIGSAVCRGLRERGYTPIVGYHRQAEEAERVAAATDGLPLQIDLADPSSIDGALARLAELPKLAGVVFAGSPPPSLIPFGKLTESDLSLPWQVNVLGPQRLLASLVKRHFRPRKFGTVIGVLTDAMGRGELGIEDASSGMAAYLIAKHGLAGLLASAAAEYPWLKVHAVRPGYTETRMLNAFDPRFLELQRSKLSFATPEQVANSILRFTVETP